MKKFITSLIIISVIFSQNYFVTFSQSNLYVDETAKMFVQAVHFITVYAKKKVKQNTINHQRILISACDIPKNNLPSNININKVRSTWLDWTNTARAEKELPPYIINDALNFSATVWSETSKKRGYMDHKRPGTTKYYDYEAINSWYKDLGITFDNTYGVTHTENIHWGRYDCAETKDDCTDELINKIRYGFDYFMDEEDDEYRPHYDSVMNKYFKEIGIGAAIDTQNKKYYLTIHYGVKATANNELPCS